MPAFAHQFVMTFLSAVVNKQGVVKSLYKMINGKLYPPQ